MASTAKRYRAYTLTEGRNGRGEGEDREFDTWPVEEVAFEGAVSDGAAVFDAGKTKISKVVFYSGPAADEAVVTSVEVGKAGQISVSAGE